MNNKLLKVIKILILSIVTLILFFITLIITSIYMETKSLSTKIVDYEANDVVLKDEKEVITDRHLNFIVFGVDENEQRTDSILIGTVDAFDKSIDIISLYRDTFVTLLPENIQKLKENGYYVPQNGEMKINEIHSYGREFGTQMLIEQIEYETNVNFDYYAKISLDAFKYIIDEIGGVTFNVPQRMYYTDPYQNLYIDLQTGEQLLNGEQAEGLIRYRKGSSKSYGYTRGDLDRVDVQQQFIKATITQILNKNTIMNNIDSIFMTIIKYVDTNVNILDISKIIPYALIIDSNNINMYTLPVTDAVINEQSYVKLNDEYMKIIDFVFFDIKNIDTVN